MKHTVFAAAWVAIVLTAPVQGQIRTELDVPYVTGGEHKQQLDLYLPESRDFPTVLFIHEGSLRSGDRRDEPYGEMCKQFATAGIGCAAMSYRLFPSVDWPLPAEDVAQAFVWLRKHIGDRGGAPDAVALFGHSSGCTLASLVGSNRALLDRYDASPGDILGVIALGCRLNDQPPDTTGAPADRSADYFANDSWGARFGNYQALVDFVPMNHVGAHLPPFLVLIAEAERFKPPILEDAAAFVGLARDCEVDADLAILEAQTHYSSIRGTHSADDPTLRRVITFIQRIHGGGIVKPQADTSRCPS